MATTLATPITIQYPAVEGSLELDIRAGACRLTIAPAEQEAWVTGTYADPSGTLAVSTEGEGNRVVLSVPRSRAERRAAVFGTGAVADVARRFGLMSATPELTLYLGTARPFTLTLEAGASENHSELGALPITRLEMSHGAGTSYVNFSAPNPTVMTQLKLGVGAGRTEVRKLSNANFEHMSVEGGVATYVLDFGGDVRRTAEVNLATAKGSIEMRIPTALAVEVTSENLRGQPLVDAGFTKQGSRWVSKPVIDGKPPVLRIRSSMVLGQLSLVTT